nr:hypothetical protein [uncultured Blautia sp.]
MGRAKKNPEYDPEKVMEQLTNCIVDAYGTGTDNNSLRKISEQFGITLMKTRKILITAGVYHTEISDQINSLWEDNWSISDIMKETGLSRSSVHSYLPYTKAIYNAEELSLYARRCRTYRKRKLAVQKLQSCMGGSMEILEEVLWDTIKVFSGYFFEMVEGERFCYSVGGDEILISKSKESITRVDVNIALEEILELNGEVSSLQKLKAPGAGYLYPVFLRFGLIRRKGESDGHLSDMDNIQ